MKKAERILGYTGLSLFLLGILFKSLHWPGAGVLLSISVLILNLGYLPLQLIRYWRKSSSKLKILYLVFRYVSLFIILLAFLWKIQHWPAASLIYTVANVLLPLLILFYIIVGRKGLTKRRLRVNEVVVILAAFAIHTFVSQTTVSPGVVHGYRVLDQQFTETNSGLQSANELLYESLDAILGPEDPARADRKEQADSSEQRLQESIRHLEISSRMVHQAIDSVRQGFLTLFTLNTENKDFWRFGLRLLTGNDLSQDYFMVHEHAHILKGILQQYENEILKIQDQHQLPLGLIGNGFDLKDQVGEWGDTISWEVRMFGQRPVAASFTNLSWFEQIALLNENVLLNELLSQMDLSQEVQLIRELAARESEKAMELKENEILRISQQQELQNIQLENARNELHQRNILVGTAFAGIALILVLLVISTRAYFRKQRDMQELAKQKKEIEKQRDEIENQRDEIEAQRDEIEAQRNLVTRQMRQLEEAHHELSSSIDYAMRLQDTILPSPALLEENFSDHLVFYRPKLKVSGDFYWWARKGEYLYIAVADCTGHGVPGAFMSLLGAGLLKEIVLGQDNSEPRQILDRLREEVIAALKQKGSMSEQKDGMDMALVRIHKKNQHCSFAGAYRPLYLVRRGRLTIYRGDVMPVSYYAEMRPFKQLEIPLEAGDQLYLFSDGFADQFGGEPRRKFKRPTFRKLLVEHADLSMHRQQQVLFDTISDWQGKNDQTDDMVVVGIRI